MSYYLGGAVKKQSVVAGGIEEACIINMHIWMMGEERDS